MKYVIKWYKSLSWLNKQVVDLLFRVFLILTVVLLFRIGYDMMHYVGPTVMFGAICVGLVWFLIDLYRAYRRDTKTLTELTKTTEAIRRNINAGTFNIGS